MTKPCCGNCAHHHGGSERITKAFIGKGAKRQEYEMVSSDYRGHGAHPNGKCVAPGARFRGMVTGFYGHCDKYQQRGKPAPEQPAPYQATIEDFDEGDKVDVGNARTVGAT